MEDQSQPIEILTVKQMIESFEDLRVWHEAIMLCTDVHVVFKDCRNYPLRDQLFKSAISIPSNIAEGFERHSNKEYIQFLYVSKASCGELRTQLLIAANIGCIEKTYGERLIDRAKKISSMLYKLINARLKF